MTRCDTFCRLIWITLTLACQCSQRICQSYLLENWNTPIPGSCHKNWYIKTHLTYWRLREEFYENSSFVWLRAGGLVIRIALCAGSCHFSHSSGCSGHTASYSTWNQTSKSHRLSQLCVQPILHYLTGLKELTLFFLIKLGKLVGWGWGVVVLYYVSNPEPCVCKPICNHWIISLVVFGPFINNNTQQLNEFSSH